MPDWWRHRPQSVWLSGYVPNRATPGRPLTIAASAPVQRNPCLRPRPGKRLNVDLDRARLGRLIGDPSTVWRHLSIGFGAGGIGMQGLRLR